MSLDAGGRVYAEIGEFGSGLVQIYEPSGTPVSSWTLSHQDDSYSSMVIDPAGNTYFAPYYGGFVKKYDATGTGVGAFGNPTDFPSHVGGLVLSPGGDSLFVASASEVTALRPSDGVVQRYFIVDGGAVGNGPIARDQSGHFYFLPSPGDSVLRTNAVGSREVEWAMPVAVSRITVAPDGTLYLALAAPGSGPTFWNGKGPGRIIHLSASGSILSQWGTEHIVPSAIAVAANGDVFVSDFYRGVYTGNVSGGLYRWSNQ
jgi:sugar lactone lactonase YvrE